MDNVTKLLDAGEEVDLCFLDFSKAFDVVNHRVVCAKLESLGVHPKVTAWTTSFLANRSLRVKLESSLSAEVPAPSGVPQGSVIGPLLFLVMVNDLPEVVNQFCLLFADDTKIGGRSVQREVIQADLLAVDAWAGRNGMLLNASKSQHMHIGGTPSSPLLLPDENGTLIPLPLVSSAKDLGIMIDSSLKPTTQVDSAVAKARSALAFISRTFERLTPDIFLPAYSALVRPLLEYCVQAWAPYTARDIEKMEKVQAAATRRVPGLKGLTYVERLRRLNLFSLERRRLRGDLIWTFKLIRGFAQLDPSSLFSFRRSTHLRGHPYMLEKPRVQTTIRQHSFAVRVVNPWNSLPADVVTAPSIEVFKAKLDRHWSATFPDLS